MGSQSGWARIALNTAQGYAAADAAPQSFGWMPADLLTVDARVDGTITLSTTGRICWARRSRPSKATT